MNDLIVGTMYLCTDGSIRRLRKIEDKYLYYDVPISEDGQHWIELNATYRRQVESKFTNGKVITQDWFEKCLD